MKKFIILAIMIFIDMYLLTTITEFVRMQSDLFVAVGFVLLLATILINYLLIKKLFKNEKI